MTEKKIRKSIPKALKVRAELQLENNSKCPICENREVGHFQIHHIDENPSNNEMANLILICPNCHSRITKGDISRIEVLYVKIKLLHKPGEKEKEQQNVSFNGKVDNAFVGNNNQISIKNTTKKIKLNYPEGSIGFDNVKANYISHLIERYNKYKEYEVGKGNVKYGIFGAHLKKKFKIGTTRTIYNVPETKFEELSTYIQDRINKTKLAKTQGKLHKNYSEFSEFKEKNG